MIEMALPFPITFANLPSGLNPLELFDQAFKAATNGAYMKDGSIPLAAIAPDSSIEWTPELRFGGAAVGLTYVSPPKGVALQFGPMIFAKGTLTLSAKGSSVGSATIIGLPAAAAADGVGSSVDFGLVTGVGSMTGAVIGQLASGASAISIYQSGNGAAGLLSNANFNNNSSLTFSLVYLVTP